MIKKILWKKFAEEEIKVILVNYDFRRFQGRVRISEWVMKFGEKTDALKIISR